MSKFNDNLNALKQLLKDNLTADNTELITKIDKGLDDILVEHKSTEDKLSQTQEKLLEIVKGTAFKLEKEPEDTSNTQDEAMDIDKAFDDSLNEIMSNRKTKEA